MSRYCGCGSFHAFVAQHTDVCWKRSFLKRKFNKLYDNFHSIRMAWKMRKRVSFASFICMYFYSFFYCYRQWAYIDCDWRMKNSNKIKRSNVTGKFNLTYFLIPLCFTRRFQKISKDLQTKSTIHWKLIKILSVFCSYKLPVWYIWSLVGRLVDTCPFRCPLHNILLAILKWKKKIVIKFIS